VSKREYKHEDIRGKEGRTQVLGKRKSLEQVNQAQKGRSEFLFRFCGGRKTKSQKNYYRIGDGAKGLEGIR